MQHLSRILLFSLAICFGLISCEKRSQVEIANENNILIIANSSEPKGLDPHRVSGVTESKILRALFEGLLQDHPSKDKSDLGGAAQSWTHNEDKSVWTFKLRKDGKWSDGEPVKASDFAFAYRRMLSPETASPFVEMLYFLKNAKEFNQGEINDFSQVGVTAIDDLTLRLELRGPTTFLPQLTKHFTWYPVPEHLIMKLGKGNMSAYFTDWTSPENLVSNGPYKLKSWRMNHSVEVERNPLYWDAKNVTLSGVRFLPISNTYTAARMFMADQLHISDTLPSEVVDEMAESHPDVLRQENYVGSLFYRCNLKRKPLDNPKVREALSIIIDRGEITKRILRGYKPAYAVTPPMVGYDPPHIIKQDIEKAKKLLAEAGYPDGKGFPRIKILIASKETARTMAEAIQAAYLEHLNINIEIENMEWAAYLTAMQEGKYDVAAGGWIGDYLDPLTFLEMWSTGNANNRTGFSSKEFDQLLANANITADEDQRVELFKQAETIFLNNHAIIPIAWYSKNYLVHPSVENFYPLQLDNHPYKNIKLNTEKKLNTSK